MQFLFIILGYFLPFYTPNSPKNQNLKKMKNTPRCIIVLHVDVVIVEVIVVIVNVFPASPFQFIWNISIC